MRLLLPPASLQGVRLYVFAQCTLTEVQATLAGLAMRTLSGGAMLADDLLTYVKVLGKAKSAMDLEGK